MRGAPHRFAFALAIGLSLTPRVQAEDSPFQASLSCQPVAGPGRIVCELSARATQGTLVWSDALVVRAPAFARPLRSRFVLPLGAPAASVGASAKLALVASEAGVGTLELLARGVICRNGPAGEWCRPVRAPVIVELRVAPRGSPAP
jgi:hypothetical protein